MGATFKPVSSEDAYPGLVQPMGRKKFSQPKEMAPDARIRAHMTMKKGFLTDVNRFS
jgi:hypothetical protein